ncbi:MAG: CHC2 zinc finger domain-containing protein [Parcubacteria group bacterium]
MKKKRRIVNWSEVEEEIKNHIIYELRFLFPEIKTLKRRSRHSYSSPRMLCPFHQEKTPSFSCCRHYGLFNCLGCGESGSIIDYYVHRKEVDYHQAVVELARIFKIKICWSNV